MSVKATDKVITDIETDIKIEAFLKKQSEYLQKTRSNMDDLSRLTSELKGGYTQEKLEELIEQQSNTLQPK